LPPPSFRIFHEWKALRTEHLFDANGASKPIVAMPQPTPQVFFQALNSDQRTQAPNPAVKPKML
jgi:hypothetical protein